LFIWNWIVGWIIGWGGIGTLISAGFWAAWYFSPIAKPQLLHAAVVATAITISSTYVYTKGYNDGRSQVLHAQAAQDAKAKQEGDAAHDDVQNCFATGNHWDIAGDVCAAGPGDG
jgi:ferric iron reductase protein FhuF